MSLQLSKAHIKSALDSTELFFCIMSVLPPVALDVFINLRIMPLTSGNFVFPLQNRKLIPYKDYFDPVGPLSYFISQLTANKNYGIRNVVLFSILFCVSIFGISMYMLARIFIGRTNSLILSYLMQTYICCLRLEQIGGWNTTHLMLISTGFAFLIKSLTSNSFDQTSLNSVRNYGIISGLFFGLAILEKQTSLAWLLIFFLLLFILYFEIRNKDIQQCLRRSVKWVFLGGLIPGIFTTTFLILQNDFTFFIRDMISGGGKNPNFAKFPSIIWNSCLMYLPKVIFVIAGTSLALVWFVDKTQILKRFSLKAKYKNEVYEYMLLFVCSTIIWRNSGLNLPENQVGFIVVDAIICLLPYIFKAAFPKASSWMKQLMYAVALVFPSIIAELPNMKILNPINYIATNYSSLNAFIILTILISTTLLLEPRLRKITADFYDKKIAFQGVNFEMFRLLFMISNFYCIGALINLYSSGGSIYFETFMPAVIIYIVTAVKFFSYRAIALRFFPILLAIFFIVSNISISLGSPYVWFNWSEQSVLAPHTETQLPGIQGYFLSKDDQTFYERIYRDSKIAVTVAGSSESNASVFSYPQIPTAAVVTGLKINTRIKCTLFTWFDACPNSQLLADLNTFKNNLPNVIIWEPISEQTMSGNESTFVHERSALRDWEIFRINEVKLGKWKLIDSFVSPLSNGWTTNIYAVLPKK